KPFACVDYKAVVVAAVGGLAFGGAAAAKAYKMWKAKKKGSKGLAGLSRSHAKTVLKTAQQPYKGSTVVGHALSKHAGRNPDIWGKISGHQKTYNAQAMKHFREIFRGPGEFQKVTNDKGITFLEKRLSDGRGIRLQQDFTFKGFID
ncbi:hypothetical protein, partial [Pseudoalteromonas sp. PPB1]|uniref:hypothetical protein n=1 Tax=Pseudoalteromonas sp. PPB1 TaxID=2756136 RepID=UPI001E43DB2D